VAKKVKQVVRAEWEKINEQRKGVQELFQMRDDNALNINLCFEKGWIVVKCAGAPPC